MAIQRASELAVWLTAGLAPDVRGWIDPDEKPGTVPSRGLWACMEFAMVLPGTLVRGAAAVVVLARPEELWIRAVMLPWRP